MAMDLNQFLQSFFEECSESLDQMEQGLLNLDPQAENTETINTIFRGAHSIKGGAATFGFTDISTFTHVMETLLDHMRSGRKPVTREDTDLLLDSVDCVRGMLGARQQGAAFDESRVAGLKSRLEASLHNRPAPAAAPAAQKPAASDEITEDEFDALLDQLHGKGGAPGGVKDAAPVAPPSGDEEITEAEFDALLDQLHGKGGVPQGVTAPVGVEGPDWRISFRPRPGILRTGNDPLRIFRDLESIARLTVRADESTLPAFDALNPQDCHLGWTLELRGAVERSRIAEAFAWVEGDCDLRIEQVSPPPAPAEQPKAEAPPLQGSVGAPPRRDPAEGEAPRSDAVKAPVAASSGENASIRVATEKVDSLVNMVGELVITQAMLQQLADGFEMSRLPKLLDGIAQLDRNTRDLQESVMRVRMLPISFAFSRFPRLVRDLSSKLGKKIELKTSGEQTELDKTVLEKIGDPLVHLVRNSLDHGIETPEIRRSAGKPETGTLHLSACQQSGNIVIEIADDGRGLPKDKILRKARDRGLVRDDEELTDEKICELIFMPGFSTAEQVSDLSGRGVGMDVVRRNIKALGGNVEIRSQEGRGTTITIRLPLTLAILDGQTVRVGNESFIIPLVSIVESVQVSRDRVSTVAGRSEVIHLREDYLPAVRLHSVFDIEPRCRELHEGMLVVVEGEGARAALLVDELLGQQQVVIKSLEANFRRIESMAGATILGDGTVALILDVPGLIRLARSMVPPLPHAGDESEAAIDPATGSASGCDENIAA
jgi:two-component system chemotaxis sensor kinase CheA